MKSRLERQSDFINLLLCVPKKQVLSFLKHVNKEQALNIREITLNILNHNIILSVYYKRKRLEKRSFYKELGGRSGHYNIN